MIGKSIRRGGSHYKILEELGGCEWVWYIKLKIQY